MKYLYQYKRKTKNNMFNDGLSLGLKLSLPNLCPLCNFSIAPELLDGVIVDAINDGIDISSRAKIFYYCPACHDVFISEYSLFTENITFSGKLDDKRLIETALINSYPKKFNKKSFSKEIEELSPEFVNIYNQAKHAESLELYQAAGITYRKSLEFLLKDYAMKKMNVDENDIKNKPLKQCIDKYISHEKIKQLATASTYLGNDQTHYHVKHKDRDLNDFRNLIEALIHYIEMELIFEDSLDITD